MKVKIQNIVLGCLVFGTHIGTLALTGPVNKSLGKPSAVTSKAAGCAAPSNFLIMDFNDVRCRVESAGFMWLDRSLGRASYQVPKGILGVNSASSLYAGSLWMGGLDINGNIKIAANKFRTNGSDYYTGPLSVDLGSAYYDPSQPIGSGALKEFGPATISATECDKWDRFFTIRKSEVVAFNAWYECTAYSLPAGCEAIPLDADAQNRILEWPGNGDISQNQDIFLAPFYDRPAPGDAAGDGKYLPLTQGDYPWFDDILGRDDVECGVDRRVTLFGDQTSWYVFNDKGGIHAESNGTPIGLEVRAQVFGFATADEINRMTFYNYEIINRSTQTLSKTYFTQYADADLGNATDDYIGCDVSRGLGYVYNATNFDLTVGANPGYGVSPPCLGIDFFEGPYQDADGQDNPGPFTDAAGVVQTPTVLDAVAGLGIVYRGIGLGYSDGIIDNERYGMRNFKYFINASVPAGMSDPDNPGEFYNFMQGLWGLGQPATYGLNGIGGTIPCDYAFPGDSDPLGWATPTATPQAPWSAIDAPLLAGGKDLRFIQTAGPFTLLPGALNNLTVGVVYGRSSSNNLASVDVMKLADTKAQALFDNCFRIVEPPEAPVLKIQELNRELILTISNPNPNALNYKENYSFLDFNIPDAPPSVAAYDKKYKFEGYQIFQMVNAEASVSDISDIDKARLVAQCDIKNSVPVNIINFEYDEALGFDLGALKVKSENKGIRHSFQMKQDAFAQGQNTNLVNHKTYYYVAVAYGYNEFKKYDPTDPTKLDGQKKPYILSRLSQYGGSITAVAAIPHITSSEAGGTVQNSNYGDEPEITRLDGRGNNNNELELTDASRDAIVSAGKVDRLTYQAGKGPIQIKVVDPLNLADGYFELKMNGVIAQASATVNNYADNLKWTIMRYASEGGALLDSYSSDSTIGVKSEQLIPEWGLSVTIFNEPYTKIATMTNNVNNEGVQIPSVINSSISFTDSTKRWLSWVEDTDSDYPNNWIANGNINLPTVATSIVDNPGEFANPSAYYIYTQRDYDIASNYNKLKGGIAPMYLINVGAPSLAVQPADLATSTAGASNFRSATKIGANLSIGNPNYQSGMLPDVDVVFTSDKSKWTRCPIVELGWNEDFNQNGGKKGLLRKRASVGKDGLPDGTTGAMAEGHGWFPGYAIDVNTGKRLIMAFGENSSLATDNGADMLWNPTSNYYAFGFTQAAPIAGGQHPIYIGGSSYSYTALTPSLATISSVVPEYTEGSTYLSGLINSTSTTTILNRDFYRSFTWVINPMLEAGQTLLSSDVTIKARVTKKFEKYTATGLNGGLPMYSWSTKNMVSSLGNTEALVSALDLINIVPNPYYAYSEYERNRLDTRVKIVNLPEVCTVRIYNVSGKLIRTFKKDSEITSIDWDLLNFTGVPIATGVYLVHVEVPGAGEKIVKFFCGMRQIDLQGL